MNKVTVLFTSFMLGFSALAAHAETLKGSTVRADGYLLDDPSETNLFPTTIDQVGSGKEFIFDDGIVTYSANFNSDGLTLRANCDAGESLKQCNKDPGAAFVFKDNAFVDATFTPDYIDSTLSLSGGEVDPYNPKIIALIVGPDTFTSKNSKFILDISPFVAPSAVPEPGSIVLLGTGLLGFAGTVRRRFRS